MKKAFMVLLIVAVVVTAADFEYNTGGAMGTVPTHGGSASGWGEWFVVSVLNDSGHDLILTEFGFPCCGPPTGTYGWLVWVNVGGLNPPAGEASTADFYGTFSPVDSNPSTLPPVTYTYIDLSSENIVIADGNYFCFGYDVTGNGGQILYNGVETWSWYNSEWDSDSSWGRTDIFEVSADYDTALERNSWASIKTSF
ncbi:MAG: hypothetical protein K8S62_07405 [Candidatus Sabulitectum sp.]|nr:hypothetical protein [Candidatus Sabulitectum sp.]